MREYLNFGATLKGKTISKITGGIGDEEIIFTISNDEAYKLFHNQDCCESVSVEDIAGDLNDIIGTPILEAEEVTSNENPEGWKSEWGQDSFTWTFYKISTIKGSVTIRWYGASNGYYSETVEFIQCDN